MIIIAESGSTKTNWLTEDNQLFETIGFNPMFHSSDSIYSELCKQQALLKIQDKCTQVFFYGAGCSSDERKQTVADALKKYFTAATHIHIDHDMNAAAYATYSGKTGIACILGTGSNSCLFDGKQIYEEVPALGYVLGDEGSGAYFGKKLIAGYLYHELPEATYRILKEEYGLEKEKIFDAVYKKPYANVYLAAFARVITDSPDKDFMKEMVRTGFSEFFLHHVCCYKNYRDYPVHFVGSIAFHFRDVLEDVAKKYECSLGIVERNPVYRLMDWHRQQRALQPE